jgi:hypothetical protein
MNTKMSDLIFVVLIIGIVIALADALEKNGTDLSPKKFASQFNPLKRTFNNVNDCNEFVSKNSGNSEKLLLGQYACAANYGASMEKNRPSNVNFYQCILNNFTKISNDNNGKSTVTTCAESTNENQLGIYFSAFFDPAARMAKLMQSENERQNESLRSIPGQLDARGLPIGDGIVNMNIDGHLKPCMKIGLEVSCD